MQLVYTKMKTSKLSCDKIKIKILAETESHYELVAYNFYHKMWSQKSRKMKKSWVHRNYEPV